MPTKSTSFHDDVDLTAGIGERISEAASQAKDKMAELGRSTADRIDQNRESAATGLESAAATLHEKADSLPGGEKVTNLAHTAADKISSTAEYVKRHDVNGMMADVEHLVKNNPGPSLLAAAVVGFLVGRAFSND
jgi:ElaB/YqjD/DUF883 family membrane-anchored ribosome-binding protein